MAAIPNKQSAILNWITMTVNFDLPRIRIPHKMKTPGSSSLRAQFR